MDIVSMTVNQLVDEVQQASTLLPVWSLVVLVDGKYRPISHIDTDFPNYLIISVDSP